MDRTLNRLRAYLAVIACLAMASAHAASIGGEQRKGYGRLNFGFDQPAQMTATTSGTTATLVFNAPVEQSAASIRAALPAYVTSATLSADKKTLTLSMAKPYRIRQFISGTEVGLDLIGEGDESAKTEVAEVVQPPKPSTPKKPVKPTTQEEKQPAKPAAPEKKPAAAEEPKTIAAADPAADPMLTTTKTEPAKPAPAKEKVATEKKPAEKKPEPAPATHTTAQEAAPTTEAMLSTKNEPLATPAGETHTTATPEKPAEVKPAEAKPVAPAPAATTEQTQAAPAASKRESKPMIAMVKSVAGETNVDFPWTTRTAAAVFKRGRDIWVVFSRYKDVNAKLLSTVMPKNVVGVTQYSFSGNTVLRLATDGTVNARAAQIDKTYGWRLTLTQGPVRPPLDVAVSSDSLEGSVRMILAVFDVAPTLRFYDPGAGDELIVIPAYENGRASPVARNFPEFRILASTQGVALVSKRPDLDISQTRTGLIISSKNGLAVSENLPVLAPSAKPIAGTTANAAIMMPYDQWFVPPEKFVETLQTRLQGVASASKANKAESMMELVKLYLAYGMGPEAGGVLSQIREQFPQYYAANRLAMLSAVSNILVDHMDTAMADLSAPELASDDESALWRQMAMLYMPPPNAIQRVQEEVAAKNDSAANLPAKALTPEEQAKATAATVPQKPTLQFLKYSKPYIRYYPPRIRQRLASAAADAYLAAGQEEKALATYDTLLRDGILEPLGPEAEYAQAMVAQKKGEVEQALKILDRLAKQPNLRVSARARGSAAALRYSKALLTADDAADALENARLTWRSDVVERNILRDLVHIYTDAKRYDDVLRTYKAIIEAFPSDPEIISVSADMGALFQKIFLEGLADEMDPLKALSLFYEFRELTPLGEAGDKIIQHLADRLAAIDLLDRATQLLEHQVKFRSSGESRSRIGARLALLHLLNKKPQEALDVLEVTNFGGNAPELQAKRRQLTAEALTKINKNEEALGVLFSDTSKEGQLLRLDILWAMKDWPNVVNHSEDILGARPNLTDTLTMKETEVLLKLAIAYTFEGDYTQLRFLRDYYSGLIPDTGYKKIFDFITNDTNPIDPEDFSMIAQQISRTEGFLGEFKEKIAAGKLSEAIK